jgi:hypothetical protein
MVASVLLSVVLGGNFREFGIFGYLICEIGLLEGVRYLASKIV